MKKKDVCTGVVSQVDFPNRAKITVVEEKEGKKTAVTVRAKGGIAGQTVKLVVTKCRGEKIEGRIFEILAPAKKETEAPFCKNFGICGGCNYQTLLYEEEINLKKEQVLALIRPPADVLYDGIRKSPEITGYRNKMEFSFGNETKDGDLTLGLHKKGSFYDVINADCCLLVHKDFTRILVCVRGFCAEKNLSFYKKTTHEGFLRHLLVRRARASGEILVGLVVSSQEIVDFSDLVSRLLALPLDGKISGILQITNDSLADVVKSDKTEVLYGKETIEEEILGLRFDITPFSFFQTNTAGAAVLYQKVREYVGNAGANRQKTVFDLYSGTGTIAQVIAPVAKKVIGIEIVPEAVESAKKSAQKNGLCNCEFLTGDVLTVLDEIAERPDLIILDPPREGISPKALKKILDFQVETLVYISCNPASFARDLDVFSRSDYRLVQMANVDLFPHTVHVETVGLLQKRER